MHEIETNTKQPGRNLEPLLHSSLRLFVDFALFRVMVVPFLIRMFFIAGTMVFVTGGVAQILTAEGSYNPLTQRMEPPIFDFASGLFLIFIAPVLLRVWCEISIVLFRISESLVGIEESLGHQRSSS